MEELKLNKTPVMTSQNYNINYVLFNENVTNAKDEFDNCFLQDFDNESVLLLNEVKQSDLTYGIGKEDEVNKNANIKLKLEMKENSSKENIINFVFDEENRELIDNIEIIVDDDVKGCMTLRYATSYDEEEKYIQCKNCKSMDCISLKNKEDDRNDRYKKEGKNTGYHNGIITVKLKKNAQLKLTVINLLGFNTTNLISMENTLEDNSSLIYNIVDFGGNNSVTNYYSNLIGDGAENQLNSIYLGIGKQLFDMNYIAATKGKNTRMNINAQGALKDNAKKHFKGTIDFKRGGKKAIGEENEFCMLLSNEARSISLPMLLCDEEDVVGNHAAAAGKISEKELFYLMSRGFSEKEAKTLLVRAKFNQVLEQINHVNLRKEILDEINYRLENDN